MVVNYHLRTDRSSDELRDLSDVGQAVCRLDAVHQSGGQGLDKSVGHTSVLFTSSPIVVNGSEELRLGTLSSSGTLG